MDGLTIGEKIIVKATASPTYIDKRRLWPRKVLEEPREGWYVGYSFKQEGEYVPSVWLGNEIYRSAHLKNIKSVKLMRVKLDEWGNDQYAYRQDIEKAGKERRA